MNSVVRKLQEENMVRGQHKKLDLDLNARSPKSDTVSFNSRKLAINPNNHNAELVVGLYKNSMYIGI